MYVYFRFIKKIMEIADNVVVVADVVVVVVVDGEPSPIGLSLMARHELFFFLIVEHN